MTQVLFAFYRVWNEFPLVIAGFLDWCEATSSVSRHFSVCSKYEEKNNLEKNNQIAKKFISLCLRIARTSELGNYMPLIWLLTVAVNESCTSRGVSHYMITALILLGRYKVLLLWVLLMNSYSLENCKYAWEESVSVTNGSIKGEEKLQDFTDLLKFHVLCIKGFASFLWDAVFIIAHDSASFGMNSASYQ